MKYFIQAAAVASITDERSGDNTVYGSEQEAMKQILFVLYVWLQVVAH